MSKQLIALLCCCGLLLVVAVRVSFAGQGAKETINFLESVIGEKILSPRYTVVLQKSSKDIFSQTEGFELQAQPRKEPPRGRISPRFVQEGTFTQECVLTGLALFRPSNRMWYFSPLEWFRLSWPMHDFFLFFGTAASEGPWGLRGDRPIGGYFDLIGSANDVAVFRPSTGMWYYDYQHDGTTDERSPSSGWGMSEELPIAGDFDRDGLPDDVGTFRPSNGMWHYDYDHNGESDASSGPFGPGEHRPIAGDFDRDGHVDDVAVFVPYSHMWVYDYDHDGGEADEWRGPWGYAEDLPIAGDFDGDCLSDDVAVFRPSNRKWYFDFDHNGDTNIVWGPWGATGDIPVAVHHP